MAETEAAPKSPESVGVPEDDSAPLEADGVADDADSALHIDDDQFSTESLRSSIFNYQQENGRMYHALSRGKYILPNDEDENRRLDIQNYHFLVTFDGRRCFAPVEDAKRVLDVGTGTGIWAIEFADEHPDAEVIGVDLSPIQPAFTPSNCYFEVDDIEKEWTWSEPFDYIFSRMMVGSFSDWPKYVDEAYRNLNPGGWIEMVDCKFPLECDDETLTENDAIMKFGVLLAQASEALGRSLRDAENHKKRLADAGFHNIQEKLFKWPTNTWPKDSKHKEVGLWTLANIDEGLEGLSLALLTRGLGWSKEEVLVFLTQVRKDLRNRKIHAYWPIIVTYGQKPVNATGRPEPVPGET